MDIVAVILVGIVIVFVAVMLLFDPLEKYDKTLDDPDHKVGGLAEDYWYGRVPPRKKI
jgi:hypothetical protein